MLTSKDIEKASKLLAERECIISTKWDAVVVKPRREFGGLIGGGGFESFDDDLAFAVEEFRGRRIDAIDAALREFGVEPANEAKAEA